MNRQRVAVLVDGNNFYHALMERVGRKVDMRRFVERLTGLPPEEVEMRYYSALPSRRSRGAELHRGFLKALAAQGWRIFLGEVVGNREKMTDVALGVDLALLAALDRYDEAHLVSGDMDLVPAVRAARGFGKRVVAWAFQGTLSTALARAVDEVRLLEGLDWDEVAVAA
ncbi:hypothetical protein HRbin39_00120 [bacterium HR39]|nr:hypothetical protein HRbin39_00120 [bacterium HR39]